MVSKRNFWKIVALLLVFGMSVIACTNQVDKSLNGSWFIGESELQLQNGNFEETYSGAPWRKGSYTTRNGELNFVPTHINGGGFKILFGTTEQESGIESKWYSINDFITVFKSAMIKSGLSENEAEEETLDFVSSFNSSSRVTSTYNLSGKTLYVTTNGETISYTKR